ncbi:2-octaprenyl-6-methoxyphenyl hydroxylase [Meridianimarinicoccus roseus]|uniref:2-octaprenyl-6-methoxyphenyl hydroxylase n=2 Tax=Meridianimarinicoccus roseus TaxID=2072018 RepID=A0A2V2LFF9_9RHOB|nr:FAD-dependent monooxygenase [Meridianimarinicoccus roseus]PWR01927.1 2-octaprenyl-6-methoxyphenyl hydroxylase [Meridianimarinicoccus roseus]
MTDTLQSTDVLIIGGSLNGAALALALGRAGLRATVIDALPRATQASAEFDGRCYAMALASVRMLRALGLWDTLAQGAQPILDIKVSDGRAGEGPAPCTLHFDHAELEEGPMGHMVEDRHLRPALLAAIDAEPNVTHLPGTRVAAQAVVGGRAEITLDDGSVLRAPLLVGADGRTGPTAGRAGIRRRVTDYRQTALVCAIEHDRPHHGVAHQFFMPPGPLAILPLTGNRSSIVWSESAAQAAAVQAMDDDGYLTVLRPRFGSFLGEIRLAGARYTYPLNMTLASSFTAPRLALVGDAARGVHPIAGQGLNAGLRDVAALAEVVALAHRRGQDIGAPDVLALYAGWRRFDTATLAFATDTFNRLFSNDNPLLRAGRDLGLGLVNAAPSLRRAFMREAAGLTGDLPRLLTGAPL